VYGGKLAGEYIVSLLGEAGGEVVEIQGQAGTSAARDRGEGFHSVVDGNESIQVVVSQIGN
jgi:ribose transport system substrate-binding protein